MENYHQFLRSKYFNYEAHEMLGFLSERKNFCLTNLNKNDLIKFAFALFQKSIKLNSRSLERVVPEFQNMYFKALYF